MSGPASSGPTAAPPRDLPGGGAVLRRMAPFLALSLGMAAVGMAFWRPIPGGVWHDDGVYLLVGKALAEGDGLRYTGVPGAVPAVKFPPLYSGTLAVLWRIFGALGPVTLSAALLNVAFVSAAAGLVARALHQGAGFRRREAVLLAGAAFGAADVWRQTLVALSEPLFMVLAAGALAAWVRVGRREDPAHPWLLASLLAAAVLTRSAGVALVAGFAVALALRRGLRLAALTVAPAGVAAVAWGAWAARRAQEVPEELRDVLGPYSGWLGGQVAAAPAAFLAALPGHAQAVLGRLLTMLLPGVSGPSLWVLGVPLAAAAVVGGWYLARRLPPLPWIALAYLGMLLLWPYVDRRLVAPLLPWVVVTIGAGVLYALRRATSRPLRATVAVLAFGWLLAFASVTASRAATGWAAAPYQLRAGQLAAAVEVLRNVAPPDAVVGAPEFWAALHLHGGWQVAPSARFVLRREDGAAPVWGTAEEQVRTWWRVGLDHLLLEQGGTVHGQALDLLEARCPGAVAILARMPPQMVVRITWSEACAAALGLPPRADGPVTTR